MTTNNKQCIPRLRFKDFSGEWEEKKLGDIGSFQVGGDVDKSKLNSNGKYPVIANNLSNNGIVGYYNDYYKIDSPAVTITGRGTIGVAKFRGYKFTPIVRLLVFKSNCDLKFLELSINNIRIFNESTGVPQLTAPQLKKYTIMLPKNLEQQKIGAFFSKLDQLIDLQAHKIDQLQRLKRGYLQKLFPQPGEAVPRLRFKGFTDEWKEKKLKDFSIVKDGDWIESNYIFDKGDYRIIQTGNIGLGNFIDKDKEKYILQNGFQELKATEVKAGDLLICRLADPVGRAILAPSIHKKMVTSVDIAIVYPENNISKTFLKCLFNTEMMLNINLRLSSGTTRIRISRKNLANIELEIPSYEEQQKIGDFFKRMDNKIELQNKKLDELKQLKKAYLQKMFI